MAVALLTAALQTVAPLPSAAQPAAPAGAASSNPPSSLPPRPAAKPPAPSPSPAKALPSAPAPTPASRPASPPASPPAPSPAPPPAASPAALHAARPAVAALVLDAKDLRGSVLVGPSGQLYEPAAATTASAAPPRWVRRTAGGVAATVASAARLGADLFVSGAQTPLYRRRDDQWLLAQLGQRGRVLFGAGPHFSVAIGRQIFLHSQGRFTRVATAPGPVVALWAAGDSDVVFATDQVVMRRRNKAFVLAAKLPGVLGFSGAAPHAITAELVQNVRTGKKLRLPAPALRVVRSESTPAALLRLPSGALALARDLTAAATAGGSGLLELPVTEEPSLAALDTAGRALIVTTAPPAVLRAPAVPAAASGAVDSSAIGEVTTTVLVYDGTTWAPAALSDELPAPRNGPAAARSR